MKKGFLFLLVVALFATGCAGLSFNPEITFSASGYTRTHYSDSLRYGVVYIAKISTSNFLPAGYGIALEYNGKPVPFRFGRETSWRLESGQTALAYQEVPLNNQRTLIITAKIFDENNALVGWAEKKISLHGSLNREISKSWPIDAGQVRKVRPPRHS